MMMECSDTDDITAQFHLHMPPCSSATSLNERRANGAEEYFAKIPRSQKGDVRACFSMDDNSEREIILDSSNLYSLYTYIPENREQRKRGEQAAALADGYQRCGCCPDWWNEVYHRTYLPPSQPVLQGKRGWIAPEWTLIPSISFSRDCVPFFPSSYVFLRVPTAVEGKAKEWWEMTVFKRVLKGS